MSPAMRNHQERPAGPVLSAVVVSWNSAAFLDGCLSSLFEQAGLQIEVVVVDNGSTDGSAAIVRDMYPRATLVELGANKGFCAANNAGLAVARGAFVLFANADLVLEPDFASAALRPFERDDRIGIVGGKLLRFDRRTIDSAGQFLTRSRRVVERGYGSPDGPGMGAAGYVFSVCGAALLCRREMIADISVAGEFFDETYFAFSEDLDVGWRARLAGWRAWYEPAAVAYHFRGGSEGGGRQERGGAAKASVTRGVSGAGHASRASGAFEASAASGARDTSGARGAPGARGASGTRDATAGEGASLAGDLSLAGDASEGARASAPGEGLQERRTPALLRRPPELRYHILKNRWLTLIKNDAVACILRDLPAILARDAAMVGVAALTSPGVLLDLAGSSPRLVRGARTKRREFLAHKGRWGLRRTGAPLAWVRWREPRPRDGETA